MFSPLDPCIIAYPSTVSGYSVQFLRCPLQPQTPPKRSPGLLQHNLCNTVDRTHLHQPRHDRRFASVPLEPSNVSPSSPCFPQEGHSLKRYRYDRHDSLKLSPLWLAMFLPYVSPLPVPDLPVVEPIALPCLCMEFPPLRRRGMCSLHPQRCFKISSYSSELQMPSA